MKKIIVSFLVSFAFIFPNITFSQEVVLDFDSQNGYEFEYIDMGVTNILQNKSAFTIEFKFNNVEPSHAATYFAQQNGDDEAIILMERYFDDNYIRIGGAGMAKWGFDPIAGEWHHYAIVYDGNGNTNDDKLKIYLDGILQVVDSWIGTIPQSTSSLNEKFYIGCKHYGMGLIGQDIEGQYEEFRIWDKALNPTEISGIINYEATGSETDLIGFFGFNEGIPNANNQSIMTIPFNNEITGILNGFVMEGNTANFVGADTTITNIGIEENVEAISNLYPNPAKDILFLEINFINNKDLSVKILNQIGEIVKEINTTSDYQKTIKIDTIDLSSGIYFLTISGENINSMRKLVIQK